MTLYDAIFTRRSVRQYDSAPLSEAELAEIQAILDGAKQLPGQNARFEIVSADKLKGVAAPHAVLAYSADIDAALCNIGYTLQTLDLHLQSNSYGSLWMGLGKPNEPGADYRVLLAFGRTKTSPRSGEADFKRKPVLEISNQDNAVARAARLAPSAVNFQPWNLDFSPDCVTVKYNNKGIGKLFAGKFQKIDVGIMLKHTTLALEHEGEIITSITPTGSGKDFAIAVKYSRG